MDKDGVPLSFCIHPGNTNEQVTLKPTEQKLISEFEISKFVVCTDAGLSSKANRIVGDKSMVKYEISKLDEEKHIFLLASWR